jgi:hypothetical protein
MPGFLNVSFALLAILVAALLLLPETALALAAEEAVGAVKREKILP